MEECIHVDQSSVRPGAFSHVGEFFVAVGLAVGHPRPAAFLNQPQAHNILQQANLAAIADFVRQIQRHSFIADNGMVNLYTHQ